jgi:hypothetical protein
MSLFVLVRTGWESTEILLSMATRRFLKGYGFRPQHALSNDSTVWTRVFDSVPSFQVAPLKLQEHRVETKPRESGNSFIAL